MASEAMGVAERVVGDIRLGGISGGGEESPTRCPIGISEGRRRLGRGGQRGGEAAGGPSDA